MASVNLSGVLLNPEGFPDVGAIVKFTLLTTTGDTVSSSVSELIVPPDGAYSVDIVYGNLRVDYISDFKERFVAIVTVNQDTTATSLPELLNAAVPPTNAQLLQFQTILADTVTAKNAAELAETGAVAAKNIAIASSIIQFQTFAELQAHSETVDYTQYTVAERANAPYTLQPSGYVALAGDATLSNGRVAALQLVNYGLRNFGTSANWDAAFDSYIARMQYEGLDIIISSGSYSLSSQHILNGSVPVVCENGASFVTSEFADSLFKFVIETTRNGSTGWSGGEFIFNFSGSNAGSAAIELSGLDTAFLQYCDFKVDLFRGCESGILNTHTARTTSFGLENNVSWCNFKVKSQGGSTNTKYPINFTTGSGTGNNFSDSKFRVLGDGGAGLRFTGAGHVVGDILVSSSHTSATSDVAAAFIEIGDNTEYRRNICFTGCQVDANVKTPFRLSQVGSAQYKEIKWFGNLGGGTELNAALGAIEGSIILDRNVSDFRVARILNNLATGAQSIHLCDVVVPRYSACKLEVNISSFVEGVGQTMHTSIWHIRNQTGTISPILKSEENTPSAIITINSSLSGDVASIYADIAPTGVGSNINAQISAVGGIYQLIRIDPNE